MFYFLAVFFFILGLLNLNIQEWIFHQSPLHTIHKILKNKKSAFNFHMIHHSRVTRGSYLDYKEIDRYLVIDFLSLIFISVINFFLFLYLFQWLSLSTYFPFFIIAGIIGAVAFFVIHTSIHKYPEWGKKYFPWHYDHHMHFPNSNWCVTLPLTDMILGTYKKSNRQ